MSETGSDSPARLSGAQVVEGFTVQARVLKALILRETTGRYGEHKMGFLWALLEPMLLVFVFVVFLWYSQSRTTSGMPIITFTVTGIVPYLMFRNPMTQSQNAIKSNRNLLAFPQVTTFDVILARAVLETAVMICVLVVLLCFCHMIGEPVRVQNPLGVLAALGVLIIMSTGMGFLFAALVPIVPSLQQVSSLIFGRPMLIGSGLFFTAASLPVQIREWLLYNPLLHVMELLRSEFFYEFESPYGSWEYAMTWAWSSLALGLLVHQALRRRAIIGL